MQTQNLNHSPEESSPMDPEVQEAISQSKIAAALYNQHRLNLEMWADLYDKPWQLDSLQTDALIGAIKELSSKFGLDVIAMEMEDIIETQLLPLIAHREDLTMSGRQEIATQIEQLMKTSRAFRFIEQHVMPYTQL
jgi:hypothetical protein